MRKQTAALAAAAAIGVLLLCYSLNVGCAIGSVWFGEKASEPWHMNNYVVIPGQQAYICFGLSALAVGGLAAGLALPVFFAYPKSKKYLLMLAACFFTAIILTSLGFNTLDFMLGVFYWTNMTEPPPVQVPLIGAVNAWNYYFYLFVVPLWLSGFLLGNTASASSLSRNQKQQAVTQKPLPLDKLLPDKVIVQQQTPKRKASLTELPAE